MRVDNNQALSVQEVETPICARDADGKTTEWTTDGRCLAVMGSTGVRIWDLKSDVAGAAAPGADAVLVGQITRGNLVAMSLSPRGSYLLTFERIPTTANAVAPAQPVPNLLVWDLRSMRAPAAAQPVVVSAPAASLYCKQYSRCVRLRLVYVYALFISSFCMVCRDLWPTLCWSPDEALCARVVTNEVQFFAGDAKELAAAVSADGTSAKSVCVIKAENALKCKWAPTLVQ